jgi:hypothetical protein
MRLELRAAFLGAGLVVLGANSASAQPTTQLPNSQAPTPAPSGGPTVASQEVTAITGPLKVDPAYQAKGIPLGGPFRLYPFLNLGVSYDDNVFRTPAAQEEDFFFTIAPTAVLDYETSVAKVDLFGQANIYQYAKLTSVNTTNYDFGLQGRYEIVRSSRVSGGVRFRQLSEPLSSPNVVGFQSEPTQYTDFGANGAWSYKPNRLGVILAVSYDQFDFLATPLNGGGVLGNKDRNNDLLRGSIDVGYDFSPGYETFMRFTYNNNPYERTLDRSGTHRSSHGYQADAGVRLLLGNLVQGELYAGYISQNYDQAQAKPLRDVSGLDFGANVTWYPTDLMTVRLGASRSFQNTTLAGAAAGDDKNVSLSADYSLTRQIVLRASTAYDDISYKGTSPLREDQTILLGAGARYLVNNYISLDLDYRYTDRTSSVAGVEFKDNVIMLGLNLQI